MKTFVKSILFTGVLAMGANGLMAQPSANGFDQWYKAKYGRFSPQTEARLEAERVNSADREEVSGPPARPNWIEQHYKAKYGRSSPMEEARMKAEQANTAFREEPVRQATKPTNDWFDQWYRAKFGRPSPREEARLKAEGR